MRSIIKLTRDEVNNLTNARTFSSGSRRKVELTKEIAEELGLTLINFCKQDAEIVNFGSGLYALYVIQKLDLENKKQVERI